MTAWTEDVENALHAWVVAGSQLPPERVVWAQQGGPVPESPWVSMRCSVLRTLGLDWVDYTPAATPVPGGEATAHVRGPRVATLELQCYGDATAAGVAPQAVLDRVVASARLPSVSATLRAAGVSVASSEPTQFLGQVADSARFEPRAVARVQLHLASEITEPATVIETVQTVNNLT